jgi:hypothetical protein
MNFMFVMDKSVTFNHQYGVIRILDVSDPFIKQVGHQPFDQPQSGSFPHQSNQGISHKIE